MFIGVPKEPDPHEHRVGLNPSGVSRLVRQGHSVIVEKGAGEEAFFSDRDFQEAGATTVYGPEEVYGRADLVCRIGRVRMEETEMLKPGQVICAFHHLAVAPRSLVQRLMELRVTVVGYEIIQDEQGELPVLIPFSEMAGRMAVHLAAQYLRTDGGGRGILLGNVPGVPPPTILILGAGTLGRAACCQAVASGAHVIVMDHTMPKLREINREFQGRVVTALAGMTRLEKLTAIADVVIGAVLVPGRRAPYLVTEDMVKAMKHGSVIIDLSIDQGGCVETSRPTTPAEPTFVRHGVVHYCVPNMTTTVARTATRAFVNAALPYLLAHGDKGMGQAIRDDPGLAQGVYMYHGRVIHEGLAQAVGVEHVPISEIYGKDG